VGERETLLEHQQVVTMLSSTSKCTGVSGHNFIAYVIIYAIMVVMMMMMVEEEIIFHIYIYTHI